MKLPLRVGLPLALIALSAPAQAGYVETGLVAGVTRQRDLQASPLRYGAQELSLRVGGGGSVGAWRLSGGARGGLGTLHLTEPGRRQLSFEVVDPLTGEGAVRAFQEPQGSVLAGLELSARRSLGGGPLSLGPALVGDALYTADGVALGTWAWSSLELGPTLGARGERGPHALELTLGAPLASVVTRFPETLNPLLPDVGQVGGFYKTGTRLAGPGTHQALSLGLGHTLSREQRWTTATQLSAQWTRDTAPELLLRARAELSVSARWYGGRR